MHKIKRGLDLPLNGEPAQYFDGVKYTSKVALVGPDYNGMKPTMLVKPGELVKKGQKVIEDKKSPGVFYTAPATGKVVEVNRGDKRAFTSLVIERSGEGEVSFATHAPDQLETLGDEAVRALLLESGMWTALRTRPFSKVPAKDDKVTTLFVNAMDTHPLAINPQVVLEKEHDAFVNGLKVVSNLVDKIYLCTEAGATFSAVLPAKVKQEQFTGPHPAGATGTHINFLEPVSEKKSVWSVGYQDVIAFGKLFTEGRIDTTRYISLAGPMVVRPRLLKTEWGSSLEEICQGELVDDCKVRIISGSVLYGRKADAEAGYLGRFHNQISVIEEDTHRELFGWQMPGFDKHSVTRLFLSFMLPFKKFDMTSNTHGSPRAFVPIGNFEKIMPLDMMASPLVKALLSNDVEMAIKLGVLELDEEDLGLFNYVCPGKTDYGPLLRDMLTYIEKEG